MTHGLQMPISVKYHYTKSEAALNLDHAYVVQNGPRPSQAQGSIKFASMKANVALTSTFGALSTESVQLDKTNSTLAVSPLLSTPSTTLTWQSDVSIGTFGKPDPFNVDLSAGGLTSQLPIDVPAGPGGLTPPVSLSYNSEAVNGQHNPSGATGWVGEGWNLSMGSINWAEHNVYAGCTTTACGGGVNWENTWELSDPFGTSSELIPPNLNVSTYYDDSPNKYCDATTGTATPYPCPVLWHTATETHAKIYSYVGPNSLPDVTAKPPCFRVWLPNGVMEEFGCTPDSLQTYYQASVGAHLVSSWLLDLITDPQGNQIHFTYQQDNTTVASTHKAVRDEALSTVEYDSPGCRNAQTMCTGSSWNPLVRINFQANHAPRLSGVAPSGCNTGANLRCDDPLDLSSSDGIAAPEVQSTYVLNDVQVQVRPASSAGWNTLRDYRLGYEESGPTTFTDPATGRQESAAGMLNLTQFQEIGTAGLNALTYSGLDNNATKSFAYMKVFDLSSKNIVVGPSTTLSYWIYPQGSATTNLASGSNSTCVAIDLIFTDGSALRGLGAVDQHGIGMHPSAQCGHLNLDQWNQVTSVIGTSAANGKTISQINVGYDQGPNTGSYHGYIDDIKIGDSSSVNPLFATTFENGDPQPTWVSTASDAGSINNIGGVCCGLTGPEMDVRAEIAHTDSAILPMRTFTYTSALNNYYEDDQFTANSAGITKCGPSWNTGNGSGCLLWSKSYANNSSFLASASNGQGLQQTFGWGLARSNTHGVPGGGANNADPFYCNTHQSGYPCNEADDQSWSHITLVQKKNNTVRLTQNGQGGAQTSTPMSSVLDYYYKLSYPLVSQQCSDCVAGFYWGDQNDSDYLSYYNNKFMGFAQTTINLPDNTSQVHKYYATQGIGIYDTSQVTCYSAHPCHASPWWNLNNAAHGREYDTSYYDVDKTTLLKHIANSYKAICPPVGVAATPSSVDAGKTYTWDGNLVSDLDHNNPVAACDVQQTQSVDQVLDGQSSGVTTTTTPTYDNYGRITQATTTTNSGTPSQVIQKTAYIWNDAITATRTSASGTYIIDTPALTTLEDSSGNRFSCSYESYDGQAYKTGQTSGLTIGAVTTHDNYANCGTSASGSTTSGLVRTTTAYDAYGNAIASNDADANAGIASHKGCSIGTIQYTDCMAYDTTFATLDISSSNALNQTVSTHYGSGVFGGFGLWPASITSVNGQSSSFNRDTLGRVISLTMPGESSGNTTKSWTFTNWCTGTAAQAPCTEIDETDRLDNATTVTSRAFYDGEGRQVEIRKSGINGQDVVAYTYYDNAGRQIFQSNPYFIASYTGIAGPTAYSLPDSTKPGTSNGYSTQVQTSVTDANSHTATTTNSIACGAPGTSDANCYQQTTVQDANGHQTAALIGGFGKANYEQVYTGSSASTYALYATTVHTYNTVGDLITTKSPDGSVATFAYDNLGQQIGQTDPDSGTTTGTYDPNGSLIQTADARGSAGTAYIGYDGLNRVIWRNSTNSASGAWVNYSYDSTANGNNGVGELTGESFSGSGGLSGSYAYTYDVRGQQVGENITVNGTSYQMQGTYNDNGQPLTETYPTGETVVSGYSSTGWLTGLTTSAGGNTTLASNLTYSGIGGATGQISSMSLGNGNYTYAASYDNGLRLTSASVVNSSNAQLYQTQPTYDAANNIVGVQTSVGGQTDTQQFCYDDLNRLTWSGTNGTPPCSGTSINAGTLTAAQYQQNDSYNIDGGLTSGPNGNYTYGDSSHPHALTTTSNGYSAAYDAAGNMTCRALTNAATCNGSSPTGQQLTYDAQGRLSTWQDLPTLPAQTVNYLYDGSGNRVATQSTVNGTTTLTAYIGSIEEVQTTGSTTQTTTYYAIGGRRMAANVNGTFYYFGYDALGSQVAVLDSNGSLVGAQLYGPYGSSRYNTGTLPTSIGFTGQIADSVTGLDYYIARYYDPVVGQFLSVDSVQGSAQGMDPYAYVSGNPETLTDPTGLCGFGSWGDFGDCFSKAAQTAKQGASDGGNAIKDEFTGNSEGFLADTYNYFANPWRIWHNQAPLTQHQTQIQVVRPAIHAVVKWIAAIVVVVAVAAIIHHIARSTKSQPRTDKQIVKQIVKTSHDKWQEESPKKRNTSDYGGGHIQLLSGTGKLLNGANDFSSGFIGPDKDGKHVEEQVFDWAKGRVTSSDYTGVISSVKLLIYTKDNPCKPRCQPGLPGWTETLSQQAGGANVEVQVWSSNDQDGAPPTLWKTYTYSPPKKS